MTDLTALIERVESGTGRDERVDWEILCLIDPRAERSGALPGDPRYTTSLDAVLSLIEANLPGWSYDVRNDADSSPRFSGSVWQPTDSGEIEVETASSPARALLAAALRALQESRRHD